MYYLNSRYYDAGVGRFISADDVIISINTKEILEKNIISYCACDPVNNSDHEGNFYIPRWVASMSIDILIWKYAGPFAAT